MQIDCSDYICNYGRRKLGYPYSMVKPILTYGAEIWGTEYADIIERVHVEFCKQFLGVNNSVNNAVVLGECGRLPICIDYHVKSIKYWCKLLQMPMHRYPKNCYIMLKSQDEIGRNNWVTAIKQLLFQYGYGFVWLSQEIGNIDSFTKQFKQRLSDCFN